MGADGGSIPKRADLVRTRKRPVQEEPTNKVDAWKYCHLSRQPLTAPIVACSQGRLYNKEAILKHLLLRAAGELTPEMDSLAHIRGLRDLCTLRLTPNPAYQRLTTGTTVRIGERVDEATSPFLCPVTRKEINGNFCFGYLNPCGCVLAAVALTKLRAVSPMEACPQCGTKCTPKDFVPLNETGMGEEITRKPRIKREPLAESREEAKESLSLRASSAHLAVDLELPPPQELSDTNLRSVTVFRKTPAVASLYTSDKSF